MTSGPQRTARTMLVASVLSACFLNYWTYSQSFHGQPNAIMDVVHGTAEAPEQYRVAVVRTAFWLTQHTPLAMRHALALLDLASALIAVLLLYSLLERTAIYRRASREMQWFASAAFLLLVDFYLLWLLWYQRPETLPTAAVVALMLWLWTPKPGAGHTPARTLLSGVALIALAVLQGLIRADVACLLNAGILLGCFTPLRKRFALPVPAAVAVTVCCAAIAAGLQLYLMKVVYPQARYLSAPAVQLRFNLTQPLRYPPFLLFMLPAAWTLMQVLKRRFTEDATAVAFLAGSLVFAALWVVVGKIDEVRIFLPFALALAPLTVELAVLRVTAKA